MRALHGGKKKFQVSAVDAKGHIHYANVLSMGVNTAHGRFVPSGQKGRPEQAKLSRNDAFHSK